MFDRIIQIEAGNTVLCDLCNKDYTDSDESGGLLLMSNAVCPDCQERTEEGIKKYNEEHCVKGRCPEGTSFADWIRSIR